MGVTFHKSLALAKLENCKTDGGNFTKVSPFSSQFNFTECNHYCDFFGPLVPQVRNLFPSIAFCILLFSSHLPHFLHLLYNWNPCQPLQASRTHPAPYLQVGKLGESLFTPRVSTFVGSVPGVDTVEEEEHKREAVSRQTGQTARACCCVKGMMLPPDAVLAGQRELCPAPTSS